MEMATVGNEGFVGMPLFFGSQQEPLDSIAQIGGEALTISAEDFNNMIEDATTGLRKVLLLTLRRNSVRSCKTRVVTDPIALNNGVPDGF